ncbi:MAG: tRNA pseudouridine(13) synthase TruD [Myxococcota bacterium]
METLKPRKHLPRITGPGPRPVGRLKEKCQDFQVDEVPAYGPEGHGEHVFVRFEKTDQTTAHATRVIADALGTDPRATGVAGMKDRRAITRQWASFFAGPHAADVAQKALDLTLPGLRILEADLHRHKLRTGHLHGNRFRVRVRGGGADTGQVRDALQVLGERGTPNYFGTQRFGRNNLERAKAWLVHGGRAPRKRFEKKLLASVLQSHTFNETCAERIRCDRFDRPVEGDVFVKHDTGGLFQTEDGDDALQRVRSFAISPTGPMWGPKMRRTDRAAAELERTVADAHGLTEEVMARLGRHGAGTRRVLRVRPGDVEVTETEGEPVFQFDLPKGAYATVFLGELFDFDDSPPDL